MDRQKRAFFNRLEAENLSLTFDDVRLRTAPSEVAANEVDLTSWFSENVPLKIPIVSAAMDTVTESNMAISMAKLGGLGVVHAGLDPENQKKEVRRVKLSLNRLIETPISFNEDRTIESILNECDERRLDFRTFPILDSDGKFVGLLTQNDFEFADSSNSAKKAMTPKEEVVSASPRIELVDAYNMMKTNKKKTLPLLDETGTVAGMYLFSDTRRRMQEDSSPYNLDSEGRLRVGAAIPTSTSALERIDLTQDYVDVYVLDSAAGDSKFAFMTLKDVLRKIDEIKYDFPDIDVVVGNISEGISAKKLMKHGANGNKSGQGPGSICTTRVETGIGRPQVSAVASCYMATNRFLRKGVPICADGGIVNNGDIPIAIAAGANSVMLGSMLAGTDESPGEIEILPDGRRVKAYRGMGSMSALKASSAARERYGRDDNTLLLAEGVEGYVPYKGSITEVIGKAVIALRKSMAYVNAPDIETHIKKTRFTRVTNAGMSESRPHDIIR